LAASLPVVLLGCGFGTFVAANVNKAQFSQYWGAKSPNGAEHGSVLSGL